MTCPRPHPKHPRRLQRTQEVYGLTCSRCHREVEIPASGPHRCPHCGAALSIDWSAK